MYPCFQLRLHVYMLACMHVCVCVCMFVCVCKYVCMHACIHVCTNVCKGGSMEACIYVSNCLWYFFSTISFLLP